MKRLLLLICLLTLAIIGIAQSPNDLNEGLQVGFDNSTGTHTLSWWGRAGQNYFVQQTDDLHVWNYLPIIEPGADQVIQWGFVSNANKGFFRLQLDLDQDGLPDSWENTFFGEDHGIMDPNALAVLRGDGLTNIQTCLLGLNPLDPYNSVANPLVQPTITLSVSPSIPTAPATITLTATATEENGSIARVDFYQDSGYFGSSTPSSTVSTFTCQTTLPNCPAGVYEFSAVAVDGAGISSTASRITVTVNPAAEVSSDSNRYVRGTSTDPTYQSVVVAVDFQKGVFLDRISNFQSKFPASDFPDGLPWFLRTEVEALTPIWNVKNVVGTTITPEQANYSVVVNGTTVGCAPPMVAFGSQGGGTPLYINQGYSFGVLAGGITNTAGNLVIKAYPKSGFNNNALKVAATGTAQFSLPYPGTAGWNEFANNGYVANFPFTQTYDGKSITLNTRIQYVAGLASVNGWGQNLAWPMLVAHQSSSDELVFKVNYYGALLSGSTALPMAFNGSGQPAYNLTYSLDFDKNPDWQSTYFIQPHFEGTPLPSAYQGKTLDELIQNAPAVTDTLAAPSGDTYKTLDNSPELKVHPTLDQFVQDMGSEPMALANYVLNEIDLTDTMGYNANGDVSDKSINLSGVSRDALATYMEGQGSPVEQCALLVYLLRATGTPCGYVFPQQDGMLMFDKQLSKLLRMQLRNAKTNTGNVDVPRLIPVNYPWVAAYIGGKWVHIFPWLKDTAVEEGYDVWDLMPTGYQSGLQWLRKFLTGDDNIRSLDTEGTDPSTLFSRWVTKQLQSNPNYSSLSIDDVGINFYNRRNYYTKWEDFPRPWQAPVVSGSNLVVNLNSIPNIFDTFSVGLYSDTQKTGKVENSTLLIDTGDMRLADIHNRNFLLYHQALNSGSSYNVYLSMEPYRTGTGALATGTDSFPTNDSRSLVNKQTGTAVLSGTSHDYELLEIKYKRHRQLPSNFVQPGFWTPFLGFAEALSGTDVRPLRKGDMAAICTSYGRVSEKMQEVHAEKYWNYQQQTAGTTGTSTANPEKSTGELLYLCGASYYNKVSQLYDSFEGLAKCHIVTMRAHGLAKLSPERNSQTGAPVLDSSGDINLWYPNVDMLFQRVASVGNGSVHLDSGENDSAIMESLAPSSGILSELEHYIINQYFQQTAAISTVKLLDIARTNSANGIVVLSSSNYVSEGAKKYTIGGTEKTLSAWAGSMWNSVTDAMINPVYGRFTTVFITPGPQTAAAQAGSAYSGMGAFIAGIGNYGALISSHMPLNGGYGGSLGFSIRSYSPPTSFFSSMLLLPTVNSGWTVQNTSYVTPSAPVYTPPVYSHSSFSLINTAVSTSSMSFLPDVSSMLSSYSYYSGLSSSSLYSVAKAGLYASIINTICQNSGNLGQTSDYRNMTSNAGTSSNGYFAHSNSVSDPVNILTGEFYIDTVDLKLNGPMPLEIRRNYGSQNKANNNFGYGWRMNYFPYMVITDTTSAHPKITAAEMDGSVIVYSWDSNESAWKPAQEDNPYLGNIFQGAPGGLGNAYNNRITLSGTDTYTLNGVDGSARIFKVRSFDQDGSGLNRRRPYLQSWTDSRGNSYTFTFGTTSTATDYGQVNYIQSSNGNFVGFYYDTYGRITEAYTGDGRRLYYSYDNFGDLVQVMLPDASTVNYDYEHLPVVGTGLTGTYFLGEDLKTNKYTRTDSTVNFLENTSDPALIATNTTFNNYSIRWTGLVLPKYSDTYTFYISCDDGARLWVNGKLIIDQWSYNGGAEVSGSIALVAGQKYDIRLDYHEVINGAYCKLSWSSAHQSKEIIPATQLFPTTNPASVYSSHLLTQETKPDGRILQNDYDTRGRVIVQRSTAGANDALVTTGSFSYANSDITLANGSFETPVIASGTFQKPPSAEWAYLGGAYIQTNGSAWGAASAPDGSQTAVLQGGPGSSGTLAQTINFPVSGSYSVSLNVAQRANYGVQPIKFSVDGVQVGSFITPTSTSFNLYQTGTFSVASGTHTIQFSTTDSTADKSSFIDGVSLVSANNGITGTTTFVDALSNTTTYTYASSQITRVDDPSGYPVIQEWYSGDDADGGYRRSLMKRTDKRGLITEYKYDARGNLKQMSVTGNLTGGSSSLETATSFMEYNARNLLTSSTDALGNVASYIYGTDAGRLYLPTSVQKSASNGVISTTILDYEDIASGSVAAYGVLKKETLAAGTSDQAETVYSHNANGFITSITKPTGTSDPAQVVNYRYNLRGELVAETDALGRTTNYAYDGRGNQMWTEWHDEGGALVSWQYNYYNRNGEIEWTQGPRYNPDDYVLKRYDAAGRLSEETKWRSEANATNNGVQAPATSDAAYATMFYIHDHNGNVTEIRDTRRNSTKMLYDGIGQMTDRMFYEGGVGGTLKAQESFGYEPGGQVTTYVSPLSGTTAKLYTSTGKPKEQDNPDGSKLYWQYDLNGRVVKETLRNGAYWTTQYDDYNRTVTRTLVSGTQTVSEVSKFDRRGNCIFKTDTEGNTFLGSYDALNRVKATAGPSTNANTAQQSTYHTYGAGGKVHIIADALNQNTYTLSDTLGRPLLVQVKDRANIVVRQTSYAYAPDFNSVTITQGIGEDAVSTTTFTDTYGNPVLVMQGGAASGTNAKVQRFDYDNAGNLVKSIDKQQLVTLHTYDALNRLNSQTLPGGAYTSFVLDAAGNQLERHMPGEQVHYQTFDSASRKTSEYLSASGTATRNFGYSYYTSGDWIGLRQSTSDPRGITFTTTYDGLLRPSVVTATGSAAQNQATTYGYDWLGRVTSIEQHYTADSGFTSGTSTLVERTYDGYGQILTEQVSIDGVLMNNFSQSWDGAGNRVSLLSGLTQKGNGAGLLTSYEYRADHLLKQVRVARGNYSTWDHSPGIMPIPTDLSDPSIHNFAYNSAGLLTSRQNPWRAFTVDQRDAFGRVTSQTGSISGTAILNEGFAYRNDSKIDTYTAVTTGTDSRHYNYNNRGQLLSEPCVSGTLAYEFDGNTSGTGAGVRTLAKLTATNLFKTTNVNGWQQVQAEANVQTSGTETIDWTYDAIGAVTSSSASLSGTMAYTWDAFGRLVRVHPATGPDWLAVYDGLGRRLRVTEPTATSGTRVIDSYYDPLVEFLELGVSITTDGQFISRTWLVYGPDRSGHYGGQQGIGGLEATIDEATSTVTPLVNDAFGNAIGSIHVETTPFDEITGEGGITTITTNWNSVRMGAYGPLPGCIPPVLDGTSVTVAQACGFQGRRIDSTGNYNVGLRIYGPVIGRFLSPDPLGHAASINLYDWCNGDPVNQLDPDGRCSSNSWSNYANTSANTGMYMASNMGRTTSSNSLSFNYQPDPINWRQVGNELAGGAFSLPGLNVVRSGYEAFTGNDLVTGNPISASRDMALEFMGSLASTSAMFVPVPGAGVGVTSVGRATIAKESGTAMRTSVGNIGSGAAESSLPQVLRNQAAGNAARDTIAASRPGSLIEQNFQVTGGLRRVDVLDGTTAIESKVGRTSLTPDVRQQLARDIKLMRSGQVDAVEWHFSPSPTTGKVGPTAPLREKLNKFGIPIVEY